MSLPQDYLQAECSVCHTVTTDWRNFEGSTLCHDCLQNVLEQDSNYETSC